MPPGVVAAISQLDSPVAVPPGAFSLASALYVADGIASRQEPPDIFPPEEWDAEYLKSIACQEKIPAWEKLSLGPKPGLS